jgi:tape measure domain-containing protein
MAAVEDVLRTRLELLGLNTHVAGMERVAMAFGLVDAKADATSLKLMGMSTAYGAAAAGMAVGLGKVVGAAADMEQMEIAFETIMGSADAGKEKLEELKTFAKVTPFNVEGAVDSARMLMGMGIAADEVIPTMRVLGDTVSALGGSTDTLQRIALNFGQIQTQGRLTGRELRDFAVNGVPVFEILQEELGLTGDQIRRIADEGISAEKGLGALTRGLDKRFGGAMERQNQTLKGQRAQLLESMKLLAVDAGTPFLKPLTAGLQGVNALVGKIGELPPAIKAAFGPAALVGIGLLGAGIIRNALRLRALRNENIELTNQHLKGLPAAQAAATGEGAVGAAAGSAAIPTKALRLEVIALAEAHRVAAAAAGLHAAAEATYAGAAGAAAQATAARAAGQAASTAATAGRAAGAAAAAKAGKRAPRRKTPATQAHTAPPPAGAPEDFQFQPRPGTAPTGNTPARAAGGRAPRGTRAPKFTPAPAAAPGDLHFEAPAGMRKPVETWQPVRMRPGPSAALAPRVPATQAPTVAPAGIEAARPLRWMPAPIRRRIMRTAAEPVPTAPPAVTPPAAVVGEEVATAGRAARLGRLGRLGAAAGRLGRLGTPAAIAGTVLADYALGKLPDEGAGGWAKSAGQGAISGAGWGLAAGMIVPGIGNAVGAGVGAVAGAGIGAYQHWQTDRKEAQARKERDPQMDELIALQKKQVDLLQRLERKQPLSTADLSAAYQQAAVDGILKALPA